MNDSLGSEAFANTLTAWTCLERTLSYEEVTEIFVRVNSLGAKLRGSDLAMAQITAEWKESLKIFEAFQSECTDKGFDLDLGIHVRTSSPSPPVSHGFGRSAA